MSLPCPRCSVGLSERRVAPTGGGSPVLVHLCGDCQGLWLDSFVLDAVCPTLSHLPDRRLEVTLLGHEGKGAPSCPRCAIAPYEFTILGVDIDLCARCGGVWLDGDEYEEAMLGEGPATPILSEAGGPYRRQAIQSTGGQVRCGRCRAHTPISETYMGPDGLVCGACHFNGEQLALTIKADEGQAGILRRVVLALLEALFGPTPAPRPKS